MFYLYGSGCYCAAGLRERCYIWHDNNSNSETGKSSSSIGNDNIHSVELPNTMRIMQAKYFHNNNNTFIRWMSWIALNFVFQIVCKEHEARVRLYLSMVWGDKMMVGKRHSLHTKVRLNTHTHTYIHIRNLSISYFSSCSYHPFSLFPFPSFISRCVYA